MCVISCDSSYKDVDVRSTTVFLQALSDQVEVRYSHVSVYFKCLFLFAGSLRKWLAHFSLIKRNREFIRIFDRIKVSRVNHELPSLHWVSLGITLTVPLKLSWKLILWWLWDISGKQVNKRIDCRVEVKTFESNIFCAQPSSPTHLFKSSRRTLFSLNIFFIICWRIFCLSPET